VHPGTEFSERTQFMDGEWRTFLRQYATRSTALSRLSQVSVARFF
jgi:hypothetical protein